MIFSAIVVSFNPNINDLLQNIKTFCNDVNHVIIVDNSSDVDLKDGIKSTANIHNFIYLDMFGNKGVASALNQGIIVAKKLNSNWVLTMDQDSYFLNDINHYKEFIRSNDTDNTLLLYPSFLIENKVELFSNEKFVMQSGNFLNVNLINKLGSFREDYFIDFVDYEYCLRGSDYNYTLQNINNVILKHNTGVKTSFSFLGCSFSYFESNPIRYYYVIRNGLITYFQYKNLQILSIVFKLFFRVILFEKNKLNKLSYIFKGFLHFCISKFGPY